MANAMIALNDHFHYNNKIARTLQQFLPPNERKMIELWFDKLLHMNKSIDQIVIRSDYMWFILLMLQNRKIREPFTKLPPFEIQPLKKFVKMHWVPQLLPLFAFISVGECHVAKNPRDILTHDVHHAKDHDALDPHIKVVIDKEKTLEKTKKGHESNQEKCVPLVSCSAHVRMEKITYCQTRSKRNGIVCTTGQNHSENLHVKGRGHHPIHLDAVTLGSLHRKTRAKMSKLKSREATLLSSKENTVLHPGPATFGHFRNSKTFDMFDLSQVMHVADSALEIAMATRAFKDRRDLTNEQLELGITNLDLRNTPLGHNCIRPPFCPLIPDKYRRIDGACNNVFHTTWGAPFTPYTRLLPASFHDGIWSPRLSVINEEPLPSPRLISTTIISDIDAPNHEYTMAVMQFGQFISHDFTQSMDMSYSDGKAISCCESDGTAALSPEDTHYACMPIFIPSRDPFFKKYGQRCMNFVRSILAPNNECTMGYSQQMNKLTHFIDSSSVYGSTPEQTSKLRSFQGGRLQVLKDYGRDFLPLSKDPEACLTMEQGSACFESGDTRTNQMITLVVMHTLFLREHNRLADALAQLNPDWHDEQLFLEARQILMAEMQVIIYKEFLPVVLGEDAMVEFGLNLQDGTKYAYDYSINVNPSVTNEFAAAAFRFGHSAVDGRLKVYGPNKMEEMIAIPEVMFYPSRIRHQDFMDEMLSTMTTEPIQDVDASISDALTKYMFRGGNPFGVDLAAINIQRGRDHGLRPYNDYRELTGLPRIKDFSEFGLEMGEKLDSVYKSIDDIDLWVGGLLERKAPGSLVGLTFRDIIAEQFARMKHGDRYFFEKDPSINPGYFSPDKLQELRKASLSRIICDNSDKTLLSRQARNAFRKPGVPGNEFTDCSGPGIPNVDLTAWQD